MKKVLPQTVQRESYKGGNGRYAQQGSHFRVCRRTETSNLLRMAALKAYGLSEPEERHAESCKLSGTAVYIHRLNAV